MGTSTSDPRRVRKIAQACEVEHGAAQDCQDRKLIRCGLSEEVLARLQVAEGDTVFLSESLEGYRITPSNPEFERQMEIGRKVMRERRNVLKELAE